MTGIVEFMLFNEPFGGVIPGAQGAVLAALLRTSTPLTGRQIHGLMSDRYSLWAVQEAIKALTRLRLITREQIGRAAIHTINEEHYATAPLRILVDPFRALTDTAREVVGDEIQAVVLFGSVARGEAGPESDLDLAVIAPREWDLRSELEDAILTRIGNDCDVVHLPAAEFLRPSSTREPLVDDILRDGIPLIGSMPGNRRGAA